MGPRMYDHVYRTVIVGSQLAQSGKESDSLIARLQPTGYDRYTGLIVFTPDVRLAVLEGPAALHVLYRHAMALAGLSAAQTLLTQRTSFRWFSALIFQEQPSTRPDFTLAALQNIGPLSPRKLHNYVSALTVPANRQLGGPRPAPATHEVFAKLVPAAQSTAAA